MKFNLTDSYVIRCKEKYDEDGLSESWKAVILISDEGKVIGMTEGDTKQLILGNYLDDGNIRVELYRFFDKSGPVYLYQFPSEYSKKNNVFGTFSVIAYRGLGGLGDCYFDFEKYIGNYDEIIQYYRNAINSINERKDILKCSIISQVLEPNINDKKNL